MSRMSLMGIGQQSTCLHDSNYEYYDFERLYFFSIRDRR